MNIQAIIDAQLAQLNNPRRAIVNSENAFVADRLEADGLHEEASAYWNYVCNRRADPFNNAQISRLLEKLELVNLNNVIPAWGLGGT